MYPIIIGSAVLFITSWNYFWKKSTSDSNTLDNLKQDDRIETFYRSLAREKRNENIKRTKE